MRDMVNAWQGKRIMIVGDSILDVWTEVKPAPAGDSADELTFVWEENKTYLGGAGNVAHNIRTLGGDPILVTNRPRSAKDSPFLELCEKVGVKTCGICFPDVEEVTRHFRFVESGRTLIRVDTPMRKIEKPEEEAVIQIIATEEMPRVDAVIISDYAKGVCTPAICQHIIQLARNHGKPCIVDPKGGEWSKYEGADVIKPNQKELQRRCKLLDSETVSVYGGICAACRDWGESPVCSTLGNQGVHIHFWKTDEDDIPAHNVNDVDPCGAGDTFGAVLALGMSAGSSVLESAKLANLAAGLACEHHGTHAVTREELLVGINRFEVTYGK